ncbi:HPr kinase/phosphorylase C-terminal domain-containing protein [Parasphingorhabdus sp. NYA22]
MNHIYSCYNLTIESEMTLTEMVVLSERPDSVDVRITQGAVDPAGLEGAEQVGPFLWATPNVLQLHVPDVARFLVSDGNSIVFDPAPDIDEDSVRVFMLGSALGALLFQRGYLVLHGNAVQIGDGCIICVGHSGAGKSTLAAAFMQRGYKLLADDVVPIDNDCRAIPGFPRIKLWQDAADKLEIDTTQLTRIRPNMEKFNLPIADNFVSKPLPVEHIYILRSDDDENGFSSTAIKGLQKFPALHANTYRQKFLDSMDLRPDHLNLCGKLASQTPITRVVRPRLGFKVDQLVDHILADLSESV